MMQVMLRTNEVLDVPALLKRYQHEVAELKRQVVALMAAGAYALPVALCELWRWSGGRRVREMLLSPN
jgi:hypothetical protein